MPSCFIALGGNLGNVAAAFEQALKRLDDQPGVAVRRVSSTHQTTPVGSSAGEVYLNAAAELDCRLPALDLLSLLQAEEQHAGRERPFHWSPRTLDLDLILYGSRLIRHPRLIVPHPAAWYRRFVLDPLHEIAAEVVHPEKRLTIGALRERLLVRPLSVVVTGGVDTQRKSLADYLREHFPQVDVGETDSAGCSSFCGTAGRETAPTLVLWLGPESPALCSPGSKRIAFEQLPLASRLDLSACAPSCHAAAAAVLQAALG